MTSALPAPTYALVSPRRAPHFKVTVAFQGPHVRVYSSRSQLARIYTYTRDARGRIRWRHAFTQPIGKPDQWTEASK